MERIQRQGTPQMSFAEDHDMIQAVAPQRPDHAAADGAGHASEQY